MGEPNDLVLEGDPVLPLLLLLAARDGAGVLGGTRLTAGVGHSLGVVEDGLAGGDHDVAVEPLGVGRRSSEKAPTRSLAVLASEAGVNLRHGFQAQSGHAVVHDALQAVQGDLARVRLDGIGPRSARGRGLAIFMAGRGLPPHRGRLRPLLLFLDLLSLQPLGHLAEQPFGSHVTVLRRGLRVLDLLESGGESGGGRVNSALHAVLAESGGPRRGGRHGMAAAESLGEAD